MGNNQQVLGTEPIGKLLIKYSLPAIIGMMVNGLYNVVDRIFIGNMPGVGPLAITGLGVTMPIMTIILAFGMLIGVGTATNISIKLGQGKKDEAEKLLGNAVALWGLTYYTKGKSNLKLHKKNLKLDKALVITIAAIGAAPFAMQLAASCVQVISNNALRTHGGDLAIGAMATINSIITLVGMPIVGISQGAQPIIGFNYGCEKYDRAEKTLKLATIAATIGLTIGWFVVQFFPEPIVSMFNSDTNLVAISVDGIRKYLSMMPLIGMSMIGANYIQSIGNAKQAMFLSLLRQVLLLVPMMLILPRFLGLNGVWFAQPTADVISFIVTFVVVRKEVLSHRGKNEEAESVA